MNGYEGSADCVEDGKSFRPFGIILGNSLSIQSLKSSCVFSDNSIEAIAWLILDRILIVA